MRRVCFAAASADANRSQVNILIMSCSFQKRNSVCDQKRRELCDQKRTRGLEDGAMEQDQRFGLRIGRGPQVVDVSIGPQAAQDGGSRWSVDGVAGQANGVFAVLAHTHGDALAPGVGPPSTGSILTFGLAVSLVTYAALPMCKRSAIHCRDISVWRRRGSLPSLLRGQCRDALHDFFRPFRACARVESAVHR